MTPVAKFFVHLADVTDFKVRDVHGEVSSDGVHILVPARDGLIENVVMNTKDDVVALTGDDYEDFRIGTGGDITDSGSLVFVYGASTVVSWLEIVGGFRDGVDYSAGCLVTTGTSASVTTLVLNGARAIRWSWALALSQTPNMTVLASGSRLEGSNPVRCDTVAVRLRSGGNDIVGTIAKVNGGTLAVSGWDVQTDVADLVRTNGDFAYNTNAARACGVGPVVCNGTSWKHLYTDATYT